MKKIIFLFAIILSFSACNDSKKMNSENSNETLKADSTETATINNSEKQKEYPADLQAVFTAHGGLDHWKKMNNLCFEMKGKNSDEIHTVSLPDRKTKIESKDWSIGKDETGVWLLNNNSAYEGNPVFYHNLMFYFYAMPFIIADPGTNYVAVEPTELDGKMYNGYKISYNENVGDSPEDEYILFFDKETHKMTWLGYTVTFKDQKKSENWKFIKYDTWQEVSGLLLPEKLVWYNVENGKPTKKKNDLKFDKITATETMLESTVFAKPTEAEYVSQ
jgi:hypothetical protein